jgi:hypothetical protein
MESSQWENLNHLFCRIVSFLTDPHNSFSIFSVNIISLHQEVRGIFVIKAAVEMQNNLHFVTNGEHLYVFCRQNQPFSRKWWNLNDQSSYFQSILKYHLLGLHSRKVNDL